MSHHACDSPSKVGKGEEPGCPRQYEYEEMHWADKSTPLLGRRNKRSASPNNSDDEEGTLSILPPPIKRAKTLKRGADDCQKSQGGTTASEMRTCSFSGKSVPSTELADDMSITAASFQNFVINSGKATAGVTTTVPV